ncbi:hypothetical protein [Halovivax limisalsi]|uniref:hypothetical protein n=1 Tax=Halovivax limisalsi TaxID=1453760 RepID=UPI001FFC4BE3|nr:hypothetical protein [Halovivax limisalsi]
MSTNAIVIDADTADQSPPSNETAVDDFEQRVARTERRRVDVTDLSADALETFLDENVGTHLVSLERRGGRTYLVLE